MTLALSALQPETISESRSDSWLERMLRVPADLACLGDHFPDFPVVPGVVQLAWAIDAAAALLGISPEVSEISRLKFRTLLRPGQDFRLRVERLTRGGFEFQLDAGDRVFSSGRCSVAPSVLS